MAAAATVLAIFESEPEDEFEEERQMPPPRRPSRPNFDETIIPREDDDPPMLDESHFVDWTPKQLSVRAINATLALAQQVGQLAAVVARLELKLKEEYEDTKTHELKSLRAAAKKTEGRDLWFKRIVTAVVTAVAVAEVLRALGLPMTHGGH